MTAYYNEIDPYAAQWLRNLIAGGHISPGDVDERSITDVRPDDLRGYTQCHFFAGIGGWSRALRLAQWPDTRAVWTGSCPCQPFSVAGAGAGMRDERHLWPHWFWLIEQCRPGVIFGEQVEAAIRHGWLDLVSSDLEGIGYAFGAAGLPAASVGAPHIRQRLWFVADASVGRRLDGRGLYRGCDASGERGEEAIGGDDRGEVEGIAAGLGAGGEPSSALGNASGIRREPGRPARPSETSGGESFGELAGHGEHCVVGDAHDAGSQGRRIGGNGADELPTRSAGLDSFWQRAELIACRDGKARPVEPGIFPLANGVSARVGKLRAAGNAIVPQVAAAFIESYLDA